MTESQLLSWKSITWPFTQGVERFHAVISLRGQNREGFAQGVFNISARTAMLLSSEESCYCHFGNTILCGALPGYLPMMLEENWKSKEWCSWDMNSQLHLQNSSREISQLTTKWGQMWNTWQDTSFSALMASAARHHLCSAADMIREEKTFFL